MKAKVSGTKKKINGTTFLLMITILLFVVMYAAGMIVFKEVFWLSRWAKRSL